MKEQALRVCSSSDAVHEATEASEGWAEDAKEETGQAAMHVQWKRKRADLRVLDDLVLLFVCETHEREEKMLPLRVGACRLLRFCANEKEMAQMELGNWACLQDTL